MSQEIEKVIEVKNVKKVYRMGKEKILAVNDVSFEILKGEFCCLLGTSGSGKSTLLNLMAGIEKLSSGQIIIKGKNIHKMSEKGLAKFRQRYLGFVFQSYNLMGSMTALENVEFPLVFKRIRPKKRKKMARDMLAKVGLKSRLQHKPKEMSGGQQQRVGIARAFVARPEIVFADEPTGNLDTKTTMEVMDLIKGIARDNNQTIVMVTHDRRLADYADKIIHILDGNIQSVEVIRDITKSEEYKNKKERVKEQEQDLKKEQNIEETKELQKEQVAEGEKLSKDSNESKQETEHINPLEGKSENKQEIEHVNPLEDKSGSKQEAEHVNPLEDKSENKQEIEHVNPLEDKSGSKQEAEHVNPLEDKSENKQETEYINSSEDKKSQETEHTDFSQDRNKENQQIEQKVLLDKTKSSN